MRRRLTWHAAAGRQRQSLFRGRQHDMTLKKLYLCGPFVAGQAAKYLH